MVLAHGEADAVTLIAREGKLSVFRAELRHALAGRGRVVIVTGPVATGRTELLVAFAAEARRQGVRFLSLTTSPATKARALAVVKQLDRELRQREETTRPEASPSGVLPDQMWDLCDRLLRRADREPLVIGVDDVHDADPASRLFLTHLARQLTASRVLLVLTAPITADGVDPIIATELVYQPHCRQIVLDTLSVADVGALVADEADEPTADRLAPELHAVSGGSPLLLRGLLHDRLADMDRACAFGGLSSAVARFLHRCDPVARRVAYGLAVLTEPSDAVTLGRLLDVTGEVTRRAMDALTVAGLLGDGYFRHPGVRAAVMKEIPADERSALHLRAARLMHDHGAAATTVARHLVAADDPTCNWAVELLYEAAEQANTDGDVTLVLDSLELACRASATDAQRVASFAMLARAEWRINPTLAARHMGRLTAAVRDGVLADRHVEPLANWLLWCGRAEEAMALARTESWPADSAGSLDRRTRRPVWLAWLYPGVARNSPECHPPETPDNATLVLNPMLHAATLLTRTLSQGAGRETNGEAERILHGAMLHERTLQVLTSLSAMVLGDRLGEAAHWCDFLRTSAASRRAPTIEALFSAVRAEIALRQGDLSAAERHAVAALGLISPKAWGVAVGMPVATLVRTLTAMGRHDAAADQFRIPTPNTLFQTVFGLFYLRARGGHFQATGRLSAALLDFRTCGELMDRWELGPALLPWRSDAAMACLGLGRTAEARKLVAAQLDLLAPDHHLARGITLRAEAAVGPAKRRPALLRRAADLLRECGARLELAHTLADLGRAYEQVGRPKLAGGAFGEARALARQCGAGQLLADLTRHPGPAEPEPSARLSDAERRVAELAARGHTNRQIAATLYLTVSTVEQHLTRVYRKMNVSSRADLRLDFANS
ncbi:AAA family ATPase [Streptosporangium saharense]|uniref:AAA family ATPase n=1 Tax=Streptosporangium saharense TaxID=1706840 RepID=UPI0036965A7E